MSFHSNDTFYRVRSFRPDPSFLAIGIKNDFAIRAFKSPLPEEVYESFQKKGREIIDALWEHPGLIKEPYKFIEDKEGNLTYLLRAVIAPGNGTCLAVKPHELKRYGDDKNLFGYFSSNVDRPTQAYALFSLWTHWADQLEVKLLSEDKH